VLRIITDSPWCVVPNAVIIRDKCCRLDKKCVTTESPTGKGLTITPTTWQNILFERPNYNRRLKRYYPADLATRFNWYSTTPPETIPNHLWLRLNRRCITGFISYMSLIVTVNTTAECLRTDCNILGDNNKNIIKKLSWSLKSVHATAHWPFEPVTWTDVIWRHERAARVVWCRKPETMQQSLTHSACDSLAGLYLWGQIKVAT